MIDKIYKTKIKGLKLFSIKNFRDYRGSFIEIFNKNEIKKKLRITFLNKQTSISISKKNVFRGFHYQFKKAIDQIVYVVEGEIIDIVIDIRKNSKTFGKYQIFKLSKNNRKVLYMSKGFAHGFYATGKKNIMIYHQSQNYIGKFDRGFLWNYKSIYLKNNFIKMILSKKDSNLPEFKNAKF